MPVTFGPDQGTSAQPQTPFQVTGQALDVTPLRTPSSCQGPHFEHKANDDMLNAGLHHGQLILVCMVLISRHFWFRSLG